MTGKRFSGDKHVFTLAISGQSHELHVQSYYVIVTPGIKMDLKEM